MSESFCVNHFFCAEDESLIHTSNLDEPELKIFPTKSLKTQSILVNFVSSWDKIFCPKIH